MSTKEELLRTKFQHPPEQSTLFSVCCPCLRPKKLKCRASDIALVLYGKEEPHEYVVEKLVIKRVPLRIFGVEEDFREYEQSLKESSNSITTSEKAIAVINFDEEEVEAKEKQGTESVQNQESQKATSMKNETKSALALSDATSGNSLRVNCNTPIDNYMDSKLSFACEPLTEPKSGDELMIRTITANPQDEMVTEVDQRIAKMSPDLEKTINTLKGVKPRPVSTQGTPMPIKNQKKRLSARNVETEGLMTKEAYNYVPCPNDNPLQGIHYTLNRTTFTPAVEEESKSVITELPLETIGDQSPKTQTSLMIEEATTIYEDATVLAKPDDSSTICATMINIPSIITTDKQGYPPSGFSSDSTNCLGSFGSRRLKNFFHTPHWKRNELGTTDFSVYHAEMVPPRVARRFSPPKYSKRREKKNLKWKIVINNPSKDMTVPTTSSSDMQLSSRRERPKRKNFWKSGTSY